MNAFVDHYSRLQPKVNDNAETSWIIVYGDVVSGLSFIGPFARREDAVIHAHDNALYAWCLAQLDYPETTEES